MIIRVMAESWFHRRLSGAKKESEKTSAMRTEIDNCMQNKDYSKAKDKLKEYHNLMLPSPRVPCRSSMVRKLVCVCVCVFARTCCLSHAQAHQMKCRVCTSCCI
eukprot:Tamp_13682.p1 GENE.Tamp_13682~~Tamp_13682.p1  ORF type:complete len:104 (+),score=9.43 Tamp_13682:1096-1407(+)